ncbi:MAG TPA: hypothetical protein VGG07_25150 [Solirubrobacteraceae bacterium]
MQWALVGGLGEAGTAFALFGLLLIVATLITAIGAAIEATSIPIVSSGLASIWRGLTGPVVNWLNGAANELLSDAQWWMRGIGWMLTQMFDGVKDAVNAVVGNVEYLYNTAIPAATAHAKSSAAGYTNAQTVTINNEIAAARTDAHNITTKAAAQAAVKEAEAVSTVHRQLVALSADNLIKAQDYADTVQGTAEHYTRTQVDAAARALTGSLGAVEAYLEGLISTRPGATGATGKAGTTGATGAAGTTGATGAAGTSAGTGTLAGDIAIPTGAAVPDVSIEDIVAGTAVVSIGAAVAVIAREFEECAVTSCAGNNNFGNLLNAALGLISLADLAVFLNAVISNPATAVTTYKDQIQSDVQGVVGASTDVWTAIESVLGI